MSPQPPKRDIYSATTPSLLANMRSLFSSRWTDADLLCVLGHANGNFVLAVDTIVRHEATGQPPGELIRLLSGGGVKGVEGNFSYFPRRRYSYSAGNNPHNDFYPGLLGGSGGGGAFRQVGGDNRPVCLGSSVSEGAVGLPSCCLIPPSSSITRMVSCDNVQVDALSYPDGESFTSTTVTQRKRQGHGRVEQEPGVIGYPPSSLGASTSSSEISHVPDLDFHHLCQREKDELLLQIFSRRRHRKHDVSVPPKPKKHQQEPSPRETDMLNIQAGIEASLKETRNTTDSNLDDEAISFAVKASKETFDEEYHRIELRNALERKMIKILLVESLSDPVKKSEEELVTKAMAESLADPVQKSEEQLIEEARENSLGDPIKKSEEDLVEEAMQKSLLPTISKEEELVESVKRLSLKSLLKSFGKKSPPASMSNNIRTSTATTCRSSFIDEDILECNSVEVDHSPPPRLDSSLEDSDFLDRKMPAQVLPETRTIDNEVKESFNIMTSLLRPDHIQDEVSAGAHNVAQRVNDC